MDARLLPDLMVFLEVVRSGSLTRAAARLHTVQSNVTARMKILEQAIGTPLLQRHARGVKPTAAGEATLAMAMRMSAVVDDLRATFGKGAKSAAVVRLRVGAIETVAASHLPKLVAAFVRRHPHVDVSVQAGSSNALVKQLKESALDVAFVSKRPPVPGFRQQLAFRDELVLVVPSAIRSLADLLATDAPLKVLVQRLGCSYTERLLALLATRSRDYRLLEIGTLEGILRFVEVGVGVAAMPRAFVRSVTGGARKVRLLELPSRLRRLDTLVMAPVGDHAPSVVNAFVATIAAPT